MAANYSIRNSSSSTGSARGRMAISAPTDDSVASGSGASTGANSSTGYIRKSASFRRWEKKQRKEAEKATRLEEEDRVAWRDRLFKRVGESTRGSQMEMSTSATMRKVEQRLNHPRSGRQPGLNDDTWPGAAVRYGVAIEDGNCRSKSASKSLNRKVKGKRIGKTNAKMSGFQHQEQQKAAALSARVEEEKEKMTPPPKPLTSTPKAKMKSTVVAAQGTSSS